MPPLELQEENKKGRICVDTIIGLNRNVIERETD
jgi:hypothetical protein